MEDESLKDKFRGSVIPDHLYWSSSLDPRVQLAQSQGAAGGKAATNGIYSEIHRQIRAAVEKESERTADALSWALDHALQRYNEATRTAEIAFRDLGGELNSADEHVRSLKADFDARTVKLRDGTRVYYDTRTGALVKEDQAGNWLTLENEDQIQQVLTAAAQNDGRMTTKQGKLALDEYERDIAYGVAYHADQRNLIALIDEAVEQEAMPLDEAAQFKEDLAEGMNDTTARLRESIRRADVETKSVAIRLQQAEFKGTAKEALTHSTAPQHLSAEFGKLFSDEPSDPEETPNPTIKPELKMTEPSV